jgi:hypothetical protein
VNLALQALGGSPVAAGWGNTQQRDDDHGRRERDAGDRATSTATEAGGRRAWAW